VLARKSSHQRWLQGLPLDWCWGDVRSAEGLAEAVNGAEWVFHAAGVTKANGLSAYMAANADGTRRIMEACLSVPAPPRRVILVSSLAAWGPCAPEEYRPDSASCLPVSHYGMSKAAAEEIALAYSDRIPITILRPTAVYGPRDRDFLSLFRLVKRGWYLEVGGVERHICMLHVRDLVSALRLSAIADVPSGSAFFVSDGENRTQGEVVRSLERAMGVRARRLGIPLAAAWIVAAAAEWAAGLRGRPALLNRQKLREMVQAGWTCRIDGTVQALGFRPSVTLDEGLRETFLWYRQQGWL
jgi:nucleoside-diphosphate-sugar epimerase